MSLGNPADNIWQQNMIMHTMHMSYVFAIFFLVNNKYMDKQTSINYIYIIGFVCVGANTKRLHIYLHA